MTEHHPPYSRPPDAPDHPFWDVQYYQSRAKHSYPTSLKFCAWVWQTWQARGGDLAPEEVVGTFETYLIRKGMSTEQCNLHDVWAWVSWLADCDLHVKYRLTLAEVHQADQVSALVEEAMDLAGHRP